MRHYYHWFKQPREQKSYCFRVHWACANNRELWVENLNIKRMAASCLSRRGRSACPIISILFRPGALTALTPSQNDIILIFANPPRVNCYIALLIHKGRFRQERYSDICCWLPVTRRDFIVIKYWTDGRLWVKADINWNTHFMSGPGPGPSFHAPMHSALLWRGAWAWAAGQDGPGLSKQ